MKRHITRTGRLLGAYVPQGIAEGIRSWVKQAPERDVSTFIRQAAREKLARESIPYQEPEA